MGRMTTADYEAIRRAQEARDYDVKPRRGPKAQLTAADWKRISEVLVDWARS
jgi:hypothetical protein